MSSPRHSVMVNRMAAALLAACALSLNGCLFMAGSNTSYEGKGKFVGSEVTSQIEPGKTTRDWVVTTLGKPSKQVKVDDETDILEYEYVTVKQDSATVLFIFAAGNSTRERKVLHVQIKNDMVEKHWVTT